MSKARELANLGNAYSDGALSNRNLVINGAMQVAQRGTSFTANGYGLDRWIFDRYLAGSSRTMSQDTDAPEGFSHSIKYANGGVAEDQYYFIHKIERKNFERLSGQTVTASFYVKASEAISDARWYLTVNGDGTGNDEVSTGTYDITTSWQRVTFTVTLGDFSGYTITDSGFMEMVPMLAADPHPNIPANASLWFTGVQLEVGDTATPFEHRSYGDELARCQRYYYQTALTSDYFETGGGSVAALTTGDITFWGRFPVEMRAAPSFTAYDRAGNVGKCSRLHNGIAWYDNQAVTTVSWSKGYLYASASGANANNAAIHYKADAEL